MPHTETENSYEAAYPVIWDVVSSYMDNLVVLAGRRGSETYSAWAFQVNQAVRRTEFINDLPTINNGADLPLGFFGESGHSQDVNNPGDDRLRIADDHDETIMELGIAVSPDDFLVVAQNPRQEAPIIGNEDDTEAIGGSFDTVDAGGSDIVQGGFGGVRSEWTRLGGSADTLPTTALSPTRTQGLIKIATAKNENHIRVGFVNNSSEDIQPRVTVVGTRYRVVNVVNEEAARAMLFGQGIPRRVVHWGGLNNSTDRTVPDDWTELEIDGDDVRQLIQQEVRGGGAGGGRGRGGGGNGE